MSPISTRIRALVITALLATPGYGACPQSTCDCLGEAKHFALVASDRLSMGLWQFHGVDNPEGPIGSSVDGDACASTASLGGSKVAYEDTALHGDLIALAGPGTVAARFGTSSGIGVDGVIATGGGQVIGDVNPGGGIDTSGTHPRFASCRQAIDDMRSASTALANLAPTQSLEPISLRGETLRVVAGPGVEVIAVPSISLRSTVDDPAVLEIMLSESTEAVIVNTQRLYLGHWSIIDVTPFADSSKVIINLPGKGPSVKAVPNQFFNVPSAYAAILAPLRTVKLYAAFDIANLFARQIVLRGAFTFDTFFGQCEVPPP